MKGFFVIMSFRSILKVFFTGGKGPTNIVQIPLPFKGKLYVSPMPFGPYDTTMNLIKEYSRRKISTVLVLVTDQEIQKKARKDIFKEYEKLSIEYHRLPIPDLTAPVMNQVRNVIPKLLIQLKSKNLAIHCNAGVGRTGVIAACLVKHVLHYSGEEAINYIQHHMMIDLTVEQKGFVVKWNQSEP